MEQCIPIDDYLQKEQLVKHKDLHIISIVHSFLTIYINLVLSH